MGVSGKYIIITNLIPIPDNLCSKWSKAASPTVAKQNFYILYVLLPILNIKAKVLYFHSANNRLCLDLHSLFVWLYFSVQVVWIIMKSLGIITR